MKKALKKTFGILLAFFAVGQPIMYFGMKSIGELNNRDPFFESLTFLLFAFGAWALLSPSKKRTDEENTAEKEPDIKVNLGTSILVYILDTFLVLLTYIAIAVIFDLIGGGMQSTLGMIGSCLAIIAAIFVGVILPGPKGFVRLRNKRKDKNTPLQK